MSINVRFETPRSLTEGDEPAAGVLEEGELFTNLFDQRIWVYDQNRIPVELGGSVRSHPIGLNHNYQVFDMTNYWDVNALIEIPDPARVLNSQTYSEHYLFLNNIDKINFSIVSNVVKIKFLYPVRWPTQYQRYSLDLVDGVDINGTDGLQDDVVYSTTGELTPNNGFYTGGITGFNNSTGELEIDTDTVTNPLFPISILIKLFTFGPSTFWRGLIQGEWAS